jgi:hypothetical protein
MWAPVLVAVALLGGAAALTAAATGATDATVGLATFAT